MNEDARDDTFEREFPLESERNATSHFRQSATGMRVMGSPFLAELSGRCAEDAELMALADEVMPGQPYSFMLFGAAHSIVLANPDDPLAPYFGKGPKAPVADDVTFAALKDFCRRRRGEISEIIKRRTVQFTQPWRASYLVALIGHLLKKGAKEPLSLVEVGCSAGLLTVFDHYYYDFGPLGRLGDPANAHIRTATFEGTPPPIPRHMPQIAERFGVDLNPIDLSDPAERFWIEGLIPPDMSDELEALCAALDVRARIPLTTIRGDAMNVVPELLPKLEHTPVIFHSVCLYQWPRSHQNKFHEVLLEASYNRTIYRLGADYIQDNPVRPSRPDPAMDLFAVNYKDGKADWEYLGVCDTQYQVKWMV